MPAIVKSPCCLQPLAAVTMSIRTVGGVSREFTDPEYDPEAELVGTAADALAEAIANVPEWGGEWTEYTPPVPVVAHATITTDYAFGGGGPIPVHHTAVVQFYQVRFHFCSLGTMFARLRYDRLRKRVLVGSVEEDVVESTPVLLERALLTADFAADDLFTTADYETWDTPATLTLDIASGGLAAPDTTETATSTILTNFRRSFVEAYDPGAEDPQGWPEW